MIGADAPPTERRGRAGGDARREGSKQRSAGKGVHVCSLGEGRKGRGGAGREGGKEEWDKKKMQEL